MAVFGGGSGGLEAQSTCCNRASEKQTHREHLDDHRHKLASKSKILVYELGREPEVNAAARRTSQTHSFEQALMSRSTPGTPRWRECTIPRTLSLTCELGIPTDRLDEHHSELVTAGFTTPRQARYAHSRTAPDTQNEGPRARQLHSGRSADGSARAEVQRCGSYWLPAWIEMPLYLGLGVIGLVMEGRLVRAYLLVVLCACETP